MPKVSEDYLLERKDQILEAAAHCFAQEGFHATSMADIIKATGLSAGSFYRYYKSKDELIGAIIDRYLASILTDFQNASQTSADPAKAVVFAIKLISKRVDEGAEPFARLLPQVWSEAMRNETIRQRGKKVYASLLEHFSSIIRRAQEQGNLRDDLDPDGTSRVMLGLVQGFILQRMLLGEDARAEAYADTVRLLLSGEK